MEQVAHLQAVPDGGLNWTYGHAGYAHVQTELGTFRILPDGDRFKARLDAGGSTVWEHDEPLENWQDACAACLNTYHTRKKRRP